jgi:hypothetical protein
MRARVQLLTVMLVLAATPVWAQDRVAALPSANACQPCPCPGTNPAGPSAPASPTSPGQNPATDPNAPSTPNLFAGATEAGTQPGAMFNPNMFGDMIGIFGQRSVTVPGHFINVPITTYTTVTTNSTSTNLTTDPPTTTTTTTTQRIPNTTYVRQQVTAVVQGIPITGEYSGFKITDNESPRPTDRVFFDYNYFSNVSRSTIPASIPSIGVQREMIGFEKTFLDGDASVGVRMPYLQTFGFTDVDTQELGDLSVLFKVAWLNEEQTGNVISTGLVVTAPTGTGRVELSDGTIAPHSVLLQPWAGGIFNLQHIYFQGFSSVVVPLDQRDPTILFNSIATGWWLYREPDNRYLTAFVPVAELHLNTPLNHRSPTEPIYFQDQLNVTVGAYTIFRRVAIGGAIGIPLVGPRPFDVEALANVNFRF